MTGPASVAMRVYERGSGETRSCGTGAWGRDRRRGGSGRGDGTWAVACRAATSRSPWRRAVVAHGPAVIVAEGELTAWLAGHLADADAPASR